MSRGPFSSHGHFEGRWTAEIWANAEAAAIYRALPRTNTFPTGSILVQKLSEATTQSAGPWFVMEKRERGYDVHGGDWSYAIVSAQGIVQDEGRLTTCARCHAEAAVDRVFGLPADAAPAPAP